MKSSRSRENVVIVASLAGVALVLAIAAAYFLYGTTYSPSARSTKACTDASLALLYTPSRNETLEDVFTLMKGAKAAPAMQALLASYAEEQSSTLGDIQDQMQHLGAKLRSIAAKPSKLRLWQLADPVSFQKLLAENKAAAGSIASLMKGDIVLGTDHHYSLESTALWYELVPDVPSEYFGSPYEGAIGTEPLLRVRVSLTCVAAQQDNGTWIAAAVPTDVVAAPLRCGPKGACTVWDLDKIELK